jgi:hypothetical protein
MGRRAMTRKTKMDFDVNVRADYVQIWPQVCGFLNGVSISRDNTCAAKS